MSSEYYTFLYEKLLLNNALDVYSTPIFMKKNRPAYKVTVLCKEEYKNEIEEILFRNTTTFGIRSHEISRTILDRDFNKLKTKYGEVTIKNGYMSNEHLKTSFEFEDLKKLAKEHNISLSVIENECIRELNKLNYE